MAKSREPKPTPDPRYLQAKRAVKRGLSVKMACEMAGLPRVSYYAQMKRAGDLNNQPAPRPAERKDGSEDQSTQGNDTENEL